MGFVYCEKFYKRKRLFEALERFTSSAIEEMRSLGLNIFEIFRKYGKRELSFLNLFDKENIHNVEKIYNILKSNGFKEEDVFCVSDFFVSLGNGDIGAEQEHCSFYNKRFCDIRRSAEQEITEKCRLFRSLFMFAGAALFILLI